MADQIQLFPNSRDAIDLLCLQCVLDACDEDDPGCLYRQTRPTVTTKRREYMADYYTDNRDKKIAAASERQKANRPERAAYMREYRARQQEK